MHELGHNLGLKHGGSDNRNFKPNYLSVMNYDFGAGFWRQTASGRLILAQAWDYSRFDANTLNELALRERIGVVAPVEAEQFVGFRTCALDGTVHAFHFNQPVDWDCSGTVDSFPVEADVNGDGEGARLRGYNDWASIVWDGGAIGGPGASAAGVAAPLVEPDWESIARRVEALGAVTSRRGGTRLDR